MAHVDKFLKRSPYEEFCGIHGICEGLETTMKEYFSESVIFNHESQTIEADSSSILPEGTVIAKYETVSVVVDKKRTSMMMTILKKNPENRHDLEQYIGKMNAIGIIRTNGYEGNNPEDLRFDRDRNEWMLKVEESPEAKVGNQYILSPLIPVALYYDHDTDTWAVGRVLTPIYFEESFHTGFDLAKIPGVSRLFSTFDDDEQGLDEAAIWIENYYKKKLEQEEP